MALSDQKLWLHDAMTSSIRRCSKETAQRSMILAEYVTKGKSYRYNANEVELKRALHWCVWFVAFLLAYWYYYY